MTSPNSIHIQAEMTPNPNTLKFNVNQVLVASGSYEFQSKEKAKDSYLASQLFDIPSVTGVLIGGDFVSITKTPSGNWQDMAHAISEKIREAVSSGKEAVSKTAKPGTGAQTESDVEHRIRHVLDEQIRPALARDGGDVIFCGYKDGIVSLHLQGACRSCPSATFTLKMGVERLLKEIIPEVREVVEV